MFACLLAAGVDLALNCDCLRNFKCQRPQAGFVLVLCVRILWWEQYEGQRTSTMHDFPSDILHSNFERGLGETGWKDVERTVSLSDFDAKYSADALE